MCYKKFKVEYYFKMYVLIYIGEIFFVCEICKIVFNRKDKFKRYMFIYENFKRYKCLFKVVIGRIKN